MIEASKVNNSRELVSEAAKAYSGRVFLEPIGDDFPCVTYEYLDHFVDHLGVYLDRKGIAAGERVIVLLDNTPLHALLFIGLTATDRIYTPVNPKFARNEIEEILEMTGASSVIYSESLAYNLPMEAVSRHKYHQCISRESEFFSAVMAVETDGRYHSYSDKDTLAEIVFTSGSTGLPKGVMLSHRAILSNSASLARRYQLESEDRLLAAVPLFHCGGQMFTVMSPIWVGAQTTVVNPQLALLKFWEIVKRHQITWSIVITAFLPVLLSGDGAGSTSLKGLLVGGSAVPADVVSRFEARFAVETYQVYGMTELAAVCLSEPLDRNHRILGAVGLPIDICEAKVVRVDGSEASVSERGEIYLSGENMFSGYMNRPDVTQEKMVGKFIKTGDIGYFDGLGNLNVVDRLDNMFNVGSENVYPSEIERVCCKLDGVEDSVVVPVRNSVTDNDIVLVYKPKSGAKIDLLSWERVLRESLSYYKVPRYKISIQELGLEDWPHTGSGKISRSDVKSQVQQHFSSSQALMA